METGPELAVGDGALGFWKALVRRDQGAALLHKTANVLNQMPKSLQAKAKGHCTTSGWPSRADAEAAFDFFIAAYGAKYHKAAERLVKDRERLLSFYGVHGRDALEAHPHHQPHRDSIFAMVR